MPDAFTAPPPGFQSLGHLELRREAQWWVARIVFAVGGDSVEIGRVLVSSIKSNERRHQVAQMFRDLVSDVVNASVGTRPVMTPGNAATAAITPADEICPYPHFPCPVCKGACCFGGADVPKTRKHGVCSKCGTFLKILHDPLGVEAMSIEEVAQLPDDERIGMQRFRDSVHGRSH